MGGSPQSANSLSTAFEQLFPGDCGETTKSPARLSRNFFSAFHKAPTDYPQAFHSPDATQTRRMWIKKSPGAAGRQISRNEPEANRLSVSFARQRGGKQ
jgi:hypothetical protein